MKYKRLLILGLIFPLLFGCVAPVSNYYPVSKDISAPPVGSTNTAFIGDTMLMQGIQIETDAIYLPSDIKENNGYVLTQGYYQKVGETETSEFYKPTKEANSGEVKVSKSAEPFQAIYINKNHGGLFCISVSGRIMRSGCKGDYERRKQTLTKANSFQQVLIYSGKIGGKINIGYREFSNNYARPAFNNDVEYDLSESNVIGYKGARIEVIRATNQDIEYKVLRNFNLAPEL